MSHFHTFDWEGGRLKLTPMGFRGQWFLRPFLVFPFPSGNGMDLKVNYEVHEDYAPAEDEQLYIQLFRDGYEGAIQIPQRFVATGTTVESEVKLGPLTYSGIYRADLYQRFGSGTAPTMLCRSIAAIHIVPNYAAWALVWSVLMMIIGGFIAKVLS